MPLLWKRFFPALRTPVTMIVEFLFFHYIDVTSGFGQYQYSTAAWQDLLGCAKLMYIADYSRGGFLRIEFSDSAAEKSLCKTAFFTKVIRQARCLVQESLNRLDIKMNIVSPCTDFLISMSQILHKRFLTALNDTLAIWLNTTKDRISTHIFPWSTILTQWVFSYTLSFFILVCYWIIHPISVYKVLFNTNQINPSQRWMTVVKCWGKTLQHVITCTGTFLGTIELTNTSTLLCTRKN